VTSTGDRIGRGCDIVTRIGSEPRWVKCETRRAINHPAASHDLFELRAIDEDELPAVGVVEDQRVAEALGYLHDHYNEGPTLSDLAAVVDVSPFHFHRVFTKHVGVSPKQYQLLKQLQVARWRLRCGREPIGSIADEVGFANHAHFTSTFRRILGVSPSEYQRHFASQTESSNGDLELVTQN
jgi:AraC-like DNA-binding protein